MIVNNLLQSITSEILDQLKTETKTVVWYGGRKVLGVVNDCLNILGGRIDYAVVDDDKINQSPLDYVWSIPLINRHISVDISKSPLLSKYHVELNQPKAVGKKIIDELGNDAVYVLSSKYSDEMTTELIGKGIAVENIVVISSEDESKKVSEERNTRLLEGRSALSLMEIHDTEYKILKHFKTFCEEKGLRYWLGGGTMLGAIRHEGFIPWDDDVDVFMPDRDYWRFIERYEDSECYELLNYTKTKDYPFYFSKISDKNTILLHHEFPIEYVMGAYIDVFPLVGYPGDERLRAAQWEMEHLTMAEWYWYKDLSVILGEDRMPVTADSILNKMILPAFDESEYVGQVSVIQQKQWVSKREDFDGYVNKRFEEEEFRIPVGYDAHLRERYGDYMALPPKEKREAHSFPMYR